MSLNCIKQKGFFSLFLSLFSFSKRHQYQISTLIITMLLLMKELICLL